MTDLGPYMTAETVHAIKIGFALLSVFALIWAGVDRR